MLVINPLAEGVMLAFDHLAKGLMLVINPLAEGVEFRFKPIFRNLIGHFIFTPRLRIGQLLGTIFTNTSYILIKFAIYWYFLPTLYFVITEKFNKVYKFSIACKRLPKQYIRNFEFVKLIRRDFAVSSINRSSSTYIVL